VLDEVWELVRVYYDRWDELPESLGDYQVEVYAWEGPGETTWLKDDRGVSNPIIRPFDIFG
jgi:hypothetical protein